MLVGMRMLPDGEVALKVGGPRRGEVRGGWPTPGLTLLVVRPPKECFEALRVLKSALEVLMLRECACPLGFPGPGMWPFIRNGVLP